MIGIINKIGHQQLQFESLPNDNIEQDLGGFLKVSK
jgi:hypothetical protein